MWHWFRRLRHRPHPERIAALDFTRVRQKLHEKFGWDEVFLDRLEADYRRFLTLFAQYPNEVFVPCCDTLDEFWHAHILDTRRYLRDCQWAFGCYLHHNPILPKGMPAHTDAWEHTKQRYHQTFCMSQTT